MYLIRLDDASDHMNIGQWNQLEQILDENDIKALVGIIPLNHDCGLLEFDEDSDFWIKVRNWQAKGWRIALHGYEHVYSSHCGGMNPVHNRSEFAGLPLEEQCRKIQNGIAIMREHGLEPDVFFAPSHTFDENTLKALCLESDIRFISDTVANDVYVYDGFTFIPQQTGRVRELPFKLTTICLHPNYMSESEIEEVEAFIIEHRNQFVDPCTIKPSTRKRNMLDWIYCRAYFLKRKLRK